MRNRKPVFSGYIYEPNTKNKTYVVYDAHRAAPVGFGVKVSLKSKTYFIQRRIEDRVVKYKVGNVADYSTPEEARFVARQLLNNAMCIHDIESQRRVAKQEVVSNKKNNESDASKINKALGRALVRSELDKLADGTVVDSVLAAAYLGISVKTLLRMRSRGLSPPSFQYMTNCILRSNRKIFYKMGELKKYRDDIGG